MKVAYIAHPIGGDVVGNLDKVQKIIRSINLLEPDVIPFAHYFVDCHALDDNIPEERERGIKNDIALMKKGFIDEVRLYGDRISKGMEDEVKLAHELGIPVRPMTDETKKAYDKPGNNCLNCYHVETDPKEMTMDRNMSELEQHRNIQRWKCIRVYHGFFIDSPHEHLCKNHHPKYTP